MAKLYKKNEPFYVTSEDEMRVVNVMVSKVLGGVEQAFLDYASVISEQQNPQLLLTAKNGLINAKLPKAQNIQSEKFNFAFNGWLNIWQIYQTIKQFQADIIITHSKKVIPILRFIANKLNIKLVAVAHNDKYKKVDLADAIFSITQYQKDVFIEKGFPVENIFVIPNMIKPQSVSLPLRDTPIATFGIIGRFDPVKGFTDFIKALSLVKQQGYPIKAVIGGKAMGDYVDEERKIHALVQQNGLADDVTFLGWVSNKEDFYGRIDVFVLPSVYESFGIVLLEAMSRKLPIISSLAKGPAEIFAQHSDCALTYPVGDVSALAENMIHCIKDNNLAKQIAANGFELAKAYTPQTVGKRLIAALNKLLEK